MTRVFRAAPRLLLVLSSLLLVNACSRGGGGSGGLQADVAAHCSDLQRNAQMMALGYRQGLNDLPHLGGELTGGLLTKFYGEATWCARVRSEGQKELVKLTQELSILLDEIATRAPEAAQGKRVGEGWSAPDASSARAEVSAKLDRVAVIVAEINKRPLKN
ncbi:hypothetical protein JY651_06750 [Pyxidicoccus parkwayensis]|uniref:Lipoprotein n=1 Tax=Pyxidicoccus parkwayensis TaxID=2813578 RepID=A0ABX7P0E7_9BACT|nr:hypothetical protein [Pyxidicoccus parkwaysis]QSQ24642.1 hypothetical protein JY651_06750 [Pyxidicoccus parkwaysis]